MFLTPNNYGMIRGQGCSWVRRLPLSRSISASRKRIRACARESSAQVSRSNRRRSIGLSALASVRDLRSSTISAVVRFLAVPCGNKSQRTVDAIFGAGHLTGCFGPLDCRENICPFDRKLHEAGAPLPFKPKACLDFAAEAAVREMFLQVN